MLFDKVSAAAPLVARHSDEAPPKRPRTIATRPHGHAPSATTRRSARDAAPKKRRRRPGRVARGRPSNRVAAANGRASTRVTTTMMTTEPLLEHTFLHTTYIKCAHGSPRLSTMSSASRRRRRRRALSTCIASNSLCCGSTMSRHLGDTCCSIHTHNLRSSWDKVCTSSGSSFTRNESTLLTKAVSALVFRRFTTAAAAATSPASYNDAAEQGATAVLSSGRKVDKNKRPGGLARRQRGPWRSSGMPLGDGGI